MEEVVVFNIWNV